MKKFNETIISVYGHPGKLWLEKLPEIVKKCEQRWVLSGLVPFPELTYNYVLHGFRHKQPVVLKLRCSVVEAEKEVCALRAFSDCGGVCVLEYDRNDGAILLPHLKPGAPLSDLVPDKDAEATSIAISVLKKLHQAPTPTRGFKQLSDVIPLFENDFEELGHFVEYARRLRRELIGSSPQILLHGDFHHGNLLFSEESGWKAIDPEGIIGDAAYDCAVFIRNPLKKVVNQPVSFIEKRIRMCSDFLRCDFSYMYNWTMLQVISSAYWSIEDGLDITNHVRFIKKLPG